jgi:phage-related protein
VIYFIIPAGTYGGITTAGLTVNLDRELSNSISMSTIQEGQIIEQSRPDGINNVKEDLSFTIKNNLNAKLIDRYFTSLNGTGTINIVFPEVTKKVVINNWTVNIKHALYPDISVNAERVYL